MALQRSPLSGAQRRSGAIVSFLNQEDEPCYKVIVSLKFHCAPGGLV